jgi:hypothetical protein
LKHDPTAVVSDNALQGASTRGSPDKKIRSLGDADGEQAREVEIVCDDLTRDRSIRAAEGFDGDADGVAFFDSDRGFLSRKDAWQEEGTQ